jgi:1-acyl-sn-glycerol-3-phosphate acyltransferase
MRSLGRRALAAFARWIARGRLRGGLDGVRVHGLDLAREALARGPVVFASNHVGWWDALVYVALRDALPGEHVVLVSDEGLRKFPFFRAFGAVPADAGGLKQLAAHLSGPGRSAWIFPQGRYRPPHQRPLDLRPGAARLAERRGATLIPVGLVYRWLEAPEPASYVGFGSPTDAISLEAAIATEIDRLDVERPELDVVVVSPPRPAPGRLGPALLSALWRWFGGAR